MLYESIKGVPNFECTVLYEKKSDYCVLIPIINEGEKIRKELKRSFQADISNLVDIVICDGGSCDGALDTSFLKSVGVNTLLTKLGEGKQGAQLRMGMWWALKREYEGIITIDGNNKDSIEDVPLFIDKLKRGFDFIQGSRFIRGGQAINTPVSRWISVKLIHAPIISITAHHRFTDTTNAYRGYSRKYLLDKKVDPFRDIFMTYELLAYLSVRASQIGLRVCEVPVKRIYPKKGKIPTKISPIKGNLLLLSILLKNLLGRYKPTLEKSKEL